MLTSSGARIAACADVLLPSHSLGCFMMSSLIGSCNVTGASFMTVRTRQLISQSFVFATF